MKKNILKIGSGFLIIFVLATLFLQFYANLYQITALDDPINIKGNFVIQIQNLKLYEVIILDQGKDYDLNINFIFLSIASFTLSLLNGLFFNIFKRIN